MFFHCAPIYLADLWQTQLSFRFSWEQFRQTVRGRQPKLLHTIRMAVAGKWENFEFSLPRLAANKSFNKNRAHNQAKHKLPGSVQTTSAVAGGGGAGVATAQGKTPTATAFVTWVWGLGSARRRSTGQCRVLGWGALATFVNYLT